MDSRNNLVFLRHATAAHQNDQPLLESRLGRDLLFPLGPWTAVYFWEKGDVDLRRIWSENGGQHSVGTYPNPTIVFQTTAALETHSRCVTFGCLLGRDKQPFTFFFFGLGFAVIFDHQRLIVRVLFPSSPLFASQLFTSSNTECDISQNGGLCFGSKHGLCGIFACTAWPSTKIHTHLPTKKKIRKMDGPDLLLLSFSNGVTA